MLEKLNYYLTEWIPQRFLKKENVSSHVCCLMINSTHINMSYGVRSSGTLKLLGCETFEYSKNSDIQSILENAVDQYHLKNAECIWILKPADYLAVLIETLPVSAAEFQSAIRFKMKDMLNFPVSDAVIDHISLPLQKNPGAKPMIMVVASRVSYLQPMVNLIQESGLNLKTIDIYEFAMRNLTSLFEDDEKTSALIYMEGKTSMIVLTSQKTLFLSRQIDIGLDTLAILSTEDANQIIEKIGLEIQRSFDFYQSQWRKPLPSRVFLSLAKKTTHTIKESLSHLLSLDIQPLDIKNLIPCESERVFEQQGHYLPVIGGLLREDVHATEY
jgi:MSHA biogenesis protein MshI